VAVNIQVAVFDTETRHRAPAEAYTIVKGITQQCNPELIYKKTDSTLRGNIGAELRAILHSFPDRRVTYAPAYPDLGRTVRNGQLYVRGVPVHQTEFAADELNPIRSSDVAGVLDGVPATILDGESNEDIWRAAALILSGPPGIAAGPAALAAALAGQLSGNGHPVRPFPKLSRCLIVNGSRHPASLAQIEFAKNNGCFENGWDYFESAAAGDGMTRAAQTGTLVSQVIHRYEAVIVFGGDTAYGIHSALGSEPFDPFGELLPGVPLSRSKELYWITKAGGFGAPDILCDIRRRLT
jgi:uncharacterized protein YgbK (DUF1537 family)